MKYYFDNPIFQNKINKESSGTAQKGFYLKQLNHSLIAVPPLEEQKRIVKNIEELEPLIDEYKKAEEQLYELNSNIKDRLKKSILQYAIEGKLVEQNPNDEPASVLLERIRNEKNKLIAEGKLKKDKNESVIFRRDNSYYEQIGKEVRCIDDEIPFDIPENWEWTRLINLTYNHGQKKPEKYFNYIDIGSIDNRNLRLNSKETIIESSKAPSRARKIVYEGDILYSTVRPYLHNMCIVDRSFCNETIASTGFAVFKCISPFQTDFLFNYMQSNSFDRFANNRKNSKGIAYPAISENKLKQALIPVPPKKEQIGIINIIYKINSIL